MIDMPFKTVDVFTKTPFKGNPVAVILSALGLDDSEMQAIANWTNLSETTFVFPPTDDSADYFVRIFTPVSELPFAGHPTIGTAYALIESGLITPHDGKLVQQCARGLIELDVLEIPDGIHIAFTLPEPDFIPLNDKQISKWQQCLGQPSLRDHQPYIVDVGPKWIVAELDQVKTLTSLKPDFASLHDLETALGITGSCIFAAYTGDDSVDISADIEVRAFAPSSGMNEDPVCGSGNGSIAAYMRHLKLPIAEKGMVTATQGRCIGRGGKISLQISDEAIHVGGHAVTCMTGHISR